MSVLPALEESYVTAEHSTSARLKISARENLNVITEKANSRELGNKYTIKINEIYTHSLILFCGCTKKINQFL